MTEAEADRMRERLTELRGYYRSLSADDLDPADAADDLTAILLDRDPS